MALPDHAADPGRPSRHAPAADSSAGAARNLPLLYAFNAFVYAYASIPVMFYFFRERGVSFSGYALLQTVYYLAVVLAEVPTGLLADRFGRRAVLVAGPLAQAAGFALIGASRSFFAFAVGEVLLGVGLAFVSGAASAMLFDTLAEAGRERDYLRVEGKTTACRLLGTSAAMALGGSLARWVDLDAPYYASAALTAMAAVAAAALREPRVGHCERPRTAAILRGALASLRSDGAVRWITAYYAALFVWLRLAFHTYQPKLAEVGFEDYFAIGVVFAALNLAAALVSRGASRIVEGLGEARTLWGMQGVLVATFAVLGLSRSPLAFLVFFAQQAPFGLHFPVVLSAANRLLPSERRATVLSLQSLIGRLAFAAYFPAFGFVADRAGLPAGYLVSAVFALAAAGVLAACRPRAKS